MSADLALGNFSEIIIKKKFEKENWRGLLFRTGK
jgi:hypothetical protein